MASTKVTTPVIKDGAVTSAKLDTNIAIDGNLTVDTNTLYVDSSNNRVGIGTSSPSALLQINTSSIGQDPLFTYNSSGINTFQLGHLGSDDPYFAMKNNSNVQQVMFRLDGGSSYINTGNVGIGTTSPDAKLDISFSGGSDSIKSASTNSTSYNGSKFHNDNSKGWHNLVYGSAYSGGSLLNIGADGAIIYGNTTSGITTLGAFNLLFGTNNTERMRIDSSGRVGIGTTSPNAELDIRSASTSNTSIKIENSTTGGDAFQLMSTGSGTSFGAGVFSIYSNDNASHRFVITSLGNVGIGTTSPTNGKLQIESPSNQISISQYPENGRLHIGHFSNGAFIGTYGDDGGFGDVIRFGTHSGDERMRITSSGNVGIGTDSPSYRLSTRTTGTTSEVIAGFGNNNIEGGLQVITSDGNLEWGLNALNARSLVFQTNQTERMRITSSGNVGIGTTSPAKLFDVDGDARFTTTSGVGVQVHNDSSNQCYIQFTNSVTGETTSDSFIVGIDGAEEAIVWQQRNEHLRFGTNNSERMRIDSSGNLLVGDTGSGLGSAGRGVIEINGASSSILGLKVGGTVKTYLFQNGDNVELNNTANGIMTFKTNAAERMRITSGGDIDIPDGNINLNGTGNINGTKLFGGDTNGGIIYLYRSSGSGTQIMRFYVGDSQVGSISTATGTSTSFNTTSDYRLKENVVPMEGALDRVDALKPSRFNFIADADKTVDGFLAHEVAEVVPEAISGEKDAVDEEGNAIYQGIDQSKLVPLLVGAIQELRAEIETLKSQINN